MTDYEDLRDAVIKHLTQKTVLLNGNGESLNQALIDSVLDPTPAGFNNYFAYIKLPDGTAYDPDLMQRVIADAVNISNFPPAIFIEGLMLEGQRISGSLNTMYHYMANEQRIPLAAFLYRPAEERPLRRQEWSDVIFPATFEEMDTVDDIKSPSLTGLRKFMRCILEYGSGDFPDYQAIEDLWKERGWLDYTQNPPVYIKRTMKGGDWSLKVSLTDHELDSPARLENLLVDIINYCRGEIDSYYDLDDVMATALVILKRRDELFEKDYPYKKLQDRTNMLVEILEGRPIWD